jgi:predicted amidophosphoribosyltransferase
VSHLTRTVRPVLLVARCPVCTGPGAAPCAGCAASLPGPPGLPVPPGLDGCHALLAYEDGARALLRAVKYRNRRDALGWLADGMAGLVIPPAGAVCTWAPTSAARRRSRGYDQAELLARAVARRWRVPAAPLLRRRPGPAQTGRTAASRHQHPGFALRRSPVVSVVVVDDVGTTGATLSAAARALRGGGARRIVGLAAARTADPRSNP